MENLLASAELAPAGTEILETVLDIGTLLIRKNISYGNSALEPVGIFSKADAVQQINNRIDDKLNRIKNEQTWAGDNDIDDLIGYLVLLKIAKGRLSYNVDH